MRKSKVSKKYKFKKKVIQMRIMKKRKWKLKLNKQQSLF